MPRFAANLSMLFTEVAFLDRFAAAARAGFDAVEFLFPYEFEADRIAARLHANGLTQALFNLPPGRFAAGERGIAALPGREQDFAASVQQALPYARATGCKRLHALSGIAAPGADLARMRATLVGNLRHAARALAAEGITLLIEPINTRDMPGYFLNLPQQAIGIIDDVGEPNLALQLDLYHCQIMQGDLARTIDQHIGRVGHVQIAGVPDRHEPDSGELNIGFLMRRLDALGYGGFVGCEYRPRARTEDGLGWLDALAGPARRAAAASSGPDTPAAV